MLKLWEDRGSTVLVFGALLETLVVIGAATGAGLLLFALTQLF
jgi:hypothetical protein